MADLGRKHVCFKCSTKFYDLHKPKAICPKCSADQAEKPAEAAPPPAPARRGPRVVDPVENEEADELGDEALAGDEDLEIETEPVLDEEIDDATGEDSYD